MKCITRALGVAAMTGAVSAGAPVIGHAQGVEGSLAPRVCEEGQPCESVGQLTTMSVQGLGLSVEGLGICLAGSICPSPGPTNPVSWVVGVALSAIGSLDVAPQSATQPLS